MKRPTIRSTHALQLCRILGLFVMLFSSTTASAQATNQTFTLEPGWNAIYLRVQPIDGLAAPAQVFSVEGVASVWNWSPSESTLEFIQSPFELDVADPAWLRWIPGNTLLTNLEYVRANHAYLVHYTGAAPIELSVFGDPRPPEIRWIAKSFHLTGFPVTEGATQTFADFFAGSRAHEAGLVYRLGGDNQNWEQVDPTVTPIDSDQAYWVYSEEGSRHLGGLEVSVPDVDRIAFGTIGVEKEVTLLNRSAGARTVTISGQGANSDLLLLANPDPNALPVDAWLALPQDVVVAAGASARTRLGFQRSAAGSTGDYTDRLIVTDQLGSYFAFPVTASVVVQPSNLAGLWVGMVQIGAVSGVHAYDRSCQECSPLVDAEGNPTDCPEKGQPAPPGETQYGICVHPAGDPQAGLPVVTDTTQPLPVARPFAYRILVHVDGANQARLVKEVIELRRDETGPNAGEAVLLTDDTAIPFFKPIALRDGEFVGRRISTPAYDFPGRTLVMTGTLGVQLDVDLVVPSDLPTNPLRHRYHPDHDGLDAQYQQETGLAAHLYEVPEITRHFGLVFDPPDPNTLLSGYSAWTGAFTEEVSGLHKNTIYSTGTFTLKRISFVDELDPAQ